MEATSKGIDVLTSILSSKRPNVLPSGRHSTPASRCPQTGQVNAVNFPSSEDLAPSTPSFSKAHTFSAFREMFSEHPVWGPEQQPARRSPAPAVIPGGKGAGSNVLPGGAKDEASPLIFQQRAWGGGQGQDLGVVQQVLREGLAGTAHAQGLPWKLAGRGQHRERSGFLMA